MTAPRGLEPESLRVNLRNYQGKLLSLLPNSPTKVVESIPDVVMPHIAPSFIIQAPNHSDLCVGIQKCHQTRFSITIRLNINTMCFQLTPTDGASSSKSRGSPIAFLGLVMPVVAVSRFRS
jgi:hypothetical protein